MAPCGMTHITPKMIRNGQMAIGDQIRLDDDLPTSAETTSSQPLPVSAENSSAQAIPVSPENSSEPAIPVHAEMYPQQGDLQAQRLEEIGRIPVPQQGNPQAQKSTDSPHYVSVSSLPLVFDQMTDYAHFLDSGTGSQASPTFQVPSNPLAPPGYSEVLSYDAIQYMNGFLRTQIGRYIRIEQLVGAEMITNRSGFLVGVGNNYVVLQEITTGNIMTFDLYSIKFVYVYYSQPVFPQFE